MAISAWFDYNVYMANKLAQVQKADSAAGWDMVKLVKAFADAGLVGEEGAKEHFEQYGQYEDVAPNAFFNATEYYRAKAAQYYDKDPKAVTDLDVAFIEVTIKNAGSSAWSHYKQYGNSENVNPSNGFDTEAYMNAKLTALNSGATDGKVYTLPELYEAFKAAELSALEHFMLYGGSGPGEVAQKYEGKVPAEFAVPEDKKVNPGGGSGQTFNLTEGVDTFVGTAVDDTFAASVVAGEKTLTAGDTLDGGAGRDTLKVYGDAGSFTGVTVKNVETFAFSGMDYSGDYALNAALYTGLETVTLQNITSKTALASGSATFKVDNMVDGGTLGIGGTITGFDQRGDGNKNVHAIQGQFVDGATVGELAVDGLSTRTLVQFGGKNLDTVNITGTTTKTGAVYLDDGLTTGTTSPATADDTIKTVNIKSAGGNFALQGDKITTVNASASTGDLYLDLDVAGSAVAKIIKTGTGDDQVWIDLVDLNKGDAIDLGAGEDMLGLTVATDDTITADRYAAIKAATAETVGFFLDYASGSGITIDASSVGGKDIFLNARTAATDDAQVITLNDVASTQTVTSGLQHKDDASGSASLVINSDEGTLGTLNVVSQTKGDVLEISKKSEFGTLNLSGAGDVTVDASGASSVKIDGSAMSGTLTATGSDAKDFITGGKGQNVITGGKGNDVIDLSASKGVHDAVGLTGVTAVANGDIFKGFEVGTSTSADKVLLSTTGTAVELNAVTEGGELKLKTGGADATSVNEFAKDMGADASSAAGVLKHIDATATNTAAGHLIVYGEGKAYLYYIAEANSNSTLDAAEVHLIGTFGDIAADGFENGNVAW